MQFNEWIANTAAELGANRAACLQALQEKSVLTFIETRMAACQAISDDFAECGLLEHPTYSFGYSESVH